ncbi:hypothetical protein FACS1894219_06360 [Clostridia bacterium]|nr:hypothetical protein FACS1894219_06360 [Clostridia bacterium]
MDSSTNPNSFEYTVPRKANGAVKMKRFIYALICYIPPIILTIIGRQFIFLAIPVLAIIFTFAYWYLVTGTIIEYKYVIHAAEFSVTELYSGIHKPKEVFRVKTKDMTAVVPATQENIDKNVTPDVKRFDYISKPDYADIYLIAANHPTLGKVAVTFDCLSRMIKPLKFYNGAATVVKDKFLY